jgi:hypothetical protein
MRAAADTAPQGAFVPSRGCTGCPNRDVCSSPRQRVHDPLHEAGRHYLCEFFRPVDRRRRSLSDLAWPWRLTIGRRLRGES